jgi:hypothetical protein
MNKLKFIFIEMGLLLLLANIDSTFSSDQKELSAFAQSQLVTVQVEDSISLDEGIDPVLISNEGIDPIVPSIEGKLTSISTALSAIHEAEVAGADVSEIQNRFIIALDMVRQAETLTFNSCSSYDECINDAKQVFLSCAIDADKLSNDARMTHHQNTIVSLVYAIITAFVISFAIIYLYRRHRSYHLRRFLDMEVR